jgi:hypothetical protein
VSDIRRFLSRSSDFFLYSLDMSAPQAFYFTAKLEIAADFIIIQYTKAVNHCQRAAGPFDYFSGIKLKVRSVRHG